MGSPFRHAASLILASPFRVRNGAIKSQINRLSSPLNNAKPETSANISDADLAVLMVKRKANASFMPNTYVFPGGAVDEADFHADFLDGYKSMFVNRLRQTSVVTDPEVDKKWCEHLTNVERTESRKSPVYQVMRRSFVDRSMPPEWALRICALRELFEEVGILIGYCLKTHQYAMFDRDSSIVGDLKLLREEVRRSADSFRKCAIDRLNIVPAFWLLDDWSNWLGPSIYPKKKRFDTIFYLLCLDQQLIADVDDQELEAGEWTQPYKLLTSHANGTVRLAPPQIYELGRLANFKSTQQLNSFVEQRRSNAVTRFLPILGVASDKTQINVLPGDDLYPKTVDEELSGIPVKQYDETADQLRSKCQRLHRMEFDPHDREFRNAKIYITIQPHDGHIKPLSVT